MTHLTLALFVFDFKGRMWRKTTAPFFGEVVFRIVLTFVIKAGNGNDRLDVGCYGDEMRGRWCLIVGLAVFFLPACSWTSGLVKKEAPTQRAALASTLASTENKSRRWPVLDMLCSADFFNTLCQRTEERPGLREQTAKRNPRVPDLLFPVPTGELSSAFGFRRGVFHRGLDICARKGDPVLACSDGHVAFAGVRKGYRAYGKAILIDHGRDVYTHYAHLSKIAVRLGEKVRKGQVIGAVGSTGRSTAPHLHLEVKVGSQFYNPLAYFPPQQLTGIKVAKGFGQTFLGPVRPKDLAQRR